VHLVKDLKVKGSSTTLKRGVKIKNIKLTDDDKEVECRVDGSVIVLKTEFLKKA
jgi:protein PhnA